MNSNHKVAIVTCKEVLDKCTGKGCFRAFNSRKDAFEAYHEPVELVSFTHCSGCNEDAWKLFEYKIEKLMEEGVGTVHVSTCIRGRCSQYEKMIHRLAQDFDVIGYTHGSALGKKENNINMKKNRL